MRSLLDAVGPSLLSATDLASRYGIEGEIRTDKNQVAHSVTQLIRGKKELTKTITGFSRFIEGQNITSAKIMHKKSTGEKTYFSYNQENPLKKQKTNKQQTNLLFKSNMRKF